MDKAISVSVRSSAPLFIEASADDFGKLFAVMNSEEQVQVLQAMVEYMRPHKLQWDYIWIELNRPENSEVLNELQKCFRTETDQ